MVNPVRKFERGFRPADKTPPSRALEGFIPLNGPFSSFDCPAESKGSSKEKKYLAGVFLFIGEEDFLKEEAIDRLKRDSSLNKTKTGQTPCRIFWVSDADFDIKEVIALARTPNLFSSSQIIVIKEIEKLRSPDTDSLLSYIKHPMTRTTLVLICNLSLRKIKQKPIPEWKFLQTLILKQTNLTMRNFSRPSELEIRYRIKNWAKDKGKRIADSEVSLLLDNLGRDLRRLYQSIEQASLYAKDSASLEQRDLGNFVGGGILFDVYKMLNAVLNGDIPAAIEILRGLRRFNTKPDVIVRTLAKELKRFYKAKKLAKEGCSIREIQSRLNIRFYADRFFSYLKKIKLEELENRLRSLLYIDVRIKTGRLKPFFALESWLLDRVS